MRALGVADAVQRRDRIGREPPSLANDGSDGFGIEIAKKAPAHFFVEPRHVVERKQDVGDRRLIGHGVPSGRRLVN